MMRAGPRAFPRLATCTDPYGVVRMSSLGLPLQKNKRRSSLVDARNSKHGGTCVGNLSPAMGTRNEEGIGLTYRPAGQCSLATQFQTRFLESIPRPTAGLNFPTLENNQLVVFV